ncbi:MULTISPECIES: DEAD/DEAH box helicase [unclassified Saccharibacter]|uniref:DEAD/DEAH box helicase n=1 Tax=unclassified Saccharibacter TaxID=2648722 RepID=UPI001321E9ED|nr:MULTISPECIES: DEAD/DEAH box helicase [unclassified Saccharibacter]MXV36333.1 DEAD/DEAH box helicase [Saccharibacter sp. EH611]MXV57192.1 DEAD/DEAH box helicase [Saccharibacter sp. EH70]MXV66448.1 DEAD/DEAH box helicase [Saccharibacter sp. EH60]
MTSSAPPTSTTSLPNTFDALGLLPALCQAAQRSGLARPTEIQKMGIPALLEGRDVLLPSQTGTGKTAAFVLPALQKLAALKEREGHETPSIPRVLILEPTRDLAMQTAGVCRQLGRQLPIRTRVVCGGVSRDQQERALADGADIIVATHGRLLETVERGDLILSDIIYLVLDEADRLLDEEFSASMTALVPYLADRPQTVFCSATLPEPVMALAKKVTRNPVRVEIAEDNLTPRRLTQRAIFVEEDEKETLLKQIAAHHLPEGRCILFVKTKQRADAIARFMRRCGANAHSLHGGQTPGERKKALARFQNNTGNVLVTTDIAARGLDIDDIQMVVNVDLPPKPDTYVHRIGRTARAGRKGRALSFIPLNERTILRDIERHISHRIRIVTVETLDQ